MAFAAALARPTVTASKLRPPLASRPFAVNTTLVQPLIRVVLADDHDLVRSGIRALLLGLDGVDVIGEARSGVELLARVASDEPDVVMTDVSMPGMDGIEAIRRIGAEHPRVRIVVLTMHDKVEIIRQAIDGGACAYLMKDSPTSALEQALRSVVAGGTYFSAGIAQRLLAERSSSKDGALTDRQVEILALLARGKSSKEVGFELNLSSKTVDAHRARIMSRLGITDLASLTRYAVRIGLVGL